MQCTAPTRTQEAITSLRPARLPQAVVDQADLSNGRNGLWWAAKEGHVDVVQMLLKRSANVNHCLHDRAELAGCSALHMAARHGHVDVLQTLLRGGANLTTPETKARDTPLHLACRQGHEAVARVLLEKGAPAEVTNDAGETPLSLAELNGNETLASLVKLHLLDT